MIGGGFVALRDSWSVVEFDILTAAYQQGSIFSTGSVSKEKMRDLERAGGGTVGSGHSFWDIGSASLASATR